MRYCAAFIAVTLLLTGCAQRVQIKSLQPAQISRAAVTKKIAVIAFKNDRVNLSGNIEAKIAQYRLDDKPYFTTVSRKDFDKVLKEQKIQDSGLVESSSMGAAASMIGAQAIISGDVATPSMKRVDYYETRTKCKKDQCWEERVYCINQTAALGAQIRMIDTQKGDIIYADSINKSASWSHCRDDSFVLPTLQMASEQLADAIAKDFVSKLAPHYVYAQVVLLEKPDLEYSDNQKLLLENALEYIKQNRYDKAQSLLTELIDSTAEKSYVPLYDLGVLKEAQGQLEEAQNLYKKADDLTVKPVEEINKAVLHIKDEIQASKQAYSQVNAN